MRSYSNPVFQHRHYAEIAKVIATTDSRESLISGLISLFAQDNGRFDKGRFLDAAKGEPARKDKR